MKIEKIIQDLFSHTHTSFGPAYQENMLKTLQKYIQFDSAGWAESIIYETKHTVQRAHLFNVSEGFTHEYNQFAYQDTFSLKAFDNPGIAFPAIVADDLDPTQSADLIKVTIKYGVYYAMGIFMFDPTTQLHQNLYLWRGKRSQRFSQQDKRLFERVTPFMVEGLRQNRHFSIIRELVSLWKQDHGVASCDEYGLLQDIDNQFISLLKLDWPNWTGPLLPVPLQKSINKTNHYKGKNTQFNFINLKECYAVTGSALNQLKQLTDREYQIGRAFANGKTYNLIADDLSIAPVTVRKHISNIYSKLSVHNKKSLKKMFD